MCSPLPDAAKNVGLLSCKSRLKPISQRPEARMLANSLIQLDREHYVHP